MKRQPTDDLLKDVLASEELAELSHAACERGLAALRVRQRRRQAIKASVWVAAPVVMLVALFISLRTPETNHVAIVPQISTSAQSTKIASTSVGKPELPPIKTISDKELLALFPNRAVALIGPPGRQQLVFLDEPRRDKNM